MRNIVLYRTIYYSLSLLFGQGLLVILRIYLVSMLAVSELWVLVRDRKSTCSFAHFFSLFFSGHEWAQFLICINVHKPGWKAVFQKNLFWCKITGDSIWIQRHLHSDTLYSGTEVSRVLFWFCTVTTSILEKNVH